jgi:bifunctional non-homologous end joining protein LigD
MLATLIAKPFKDDGWFFEPKLDGFRVIAFIKDGKVTLRSRNDVDNTQKYAPVVPSLEAQPASQLILDGEMVALDKKGIPSFEYMQNYLQSVKAGGGKAATPLLYYVFDILYLDGYDLRGVPLEQRKKLLDSVLKPSSNVKLVERFIGDGKAVYRAAIENGLEGVVAKRRDSRYETGKRSGNWLKAKEMKSDEFVIGGYTAGTGARSGTFGALLIGQYDDENRLLFSSHVGTGFDDKKLSEMLALLGKLKTDKSPFSEEVPVNGPVVWVKPKLVAEVKYEQITGEGHLRIPVFLRLRDDKPASGVHRQEVIKR